jgi:integrase
VHRAARAHSWRDTRPPPPGTLLGRDGLRTGHVLLAEYCPRQCGRARGILEYGLRSINSDWIDGELYADGISLQVPVLLIKWSLTNAELDHGRAPEMQTYTAEESARILEADEGTRYCAAIALLISAGCRLGEILGLRWEAVGLDYSSMQILTALKESEGHKWILGAPKTE